MSDGGSASVIVFGGNPVVGRVLQALLEDLGYQARFLPQDSFDEPGLLDGARLLLLTGGADTESRDTSAALVERVRAKVGGAPILKLTSSMEGGQAEKENLVRWPCRLEELKRRIDALLPGGSRSEETSLEERKGAKL